MAKRNLTGSILREHDGKRLPRSKSDRACGVTTYEFKTERGADQALQDFICCGLSAQPVGLRKVRVYR